MPLAAALLETITFSEKASMSKQHYYSYLEITAQIQLLSQPCGLSNLFDNFL